jgi:hypothetical protein
MAQLLLLNPISKGGKMAKKRRSAKQIAATRKLVALNKRRAGKSTGAKRRRVARSNPITVVSRRRRRNPIVSRAVSRRRRRNPIALGGGTSILGMLKGAAMAGAGAVAMDAAIGQINKFLPASMLGSPGQIDQGDAVKAGLTVLLGKVLNKPTRGLSMKAAQASLTIQAYNMIGSFLPASVPLGYMNPGRVVNGRAVIGPNVRQSVQRFTPGTTPLLSRYTTPGVTPMLNGVGGPGVANRMAREGFAFR